MNAEQPFAAWVGIDWEQQEHTVCLWPSAGGPLRHGTVAQTPEALAAWVAELRREFGGRPIAVCLEQARGPLVYALMPCEFLVLYPINPKQLARYREAVYPSGAKSDPADAELLVRLLREHHDKLRAWQPADELTRELRLLVEQRRKWVGERVAHTNELQQRLRESYPLALELGGRELERASFLALLQKFPSQRELQRAAPRQLARWLPTKRRVAEDPPAEELQAQRVAAIRAALPATTDSAILAHARLAVRHLVAVLQTLNEAIAECETRIEELFARHPDAELFASFPGAGKALAPRLAAAYGTDRGKFQDAREMQQLSGIAPVTKASGKSRVVSMRWAAPKFLRQTFHEFASHSVRASRWAAAYVAQRRASGQCYQAILRSLAFKWQRIIFRCWQTHQLYDEERYLQRLRQTNSPLLNFLPQLEPVP